MVLFGSRFGYIVGMDYRLPYPTYPLVDLQPPLDEAQDVNVADMITIVIIAKIKRFMFVLFVVYNLLSCFWGEFPLPMELEGRHMHVC